MSTETRPNSSVFDRLVNELSHEERQELLAQLRFSQAVEETPLREPEPSPESRFDRVYKELTFLERVMLFVRTLMTGKDKVTLVQEVALKRVVKAVGARAGEYFNPRTLDMLPLFFEQIDQLEKAALFFRGPLYDPLGRHKKEFVAFLAGVEFPAVQERLLRETNPESHDSSVTELSGFDMKRTLDASLRDLMEEVGEGERQRMYRNMQLLHWLQRFSTYAFDRLPGRTRREGEQQSVSGSNVVGYLKELASILQRLTVPPSTRLVSTVLLFNLRDQMSDQEFDLENAIKTSIEQARASLTALRTFNGRVPLNDIIRIIVKDSDWVPQFRGGGEDWFVLFKQFWTERLEEKTGAFVQRRTRAHLLETALKLLHLADLPYLRNYRSSGPFEGFDPAYADSMAFLYGFLEQVLGRALNGPLKIFLLDGKFYKDDNRQEFAESFDVLDRLPGRIRSFDAALTAEGALGEALARIADPSVLPAGEVRAQSTVHEAADREAGHLVEEGKRSLRRLQLVAEGILYGQGDQTYDTISNLSQIGGRDNRKLLIGMRTILGQLAIANEVLGGLIEIEGEPEE